jgi:hypothetical protein
MEHAVLTTGFRLPNVDNQTWAGGSRRSRGNQPIGRVRFGLSLEFLAWLS